VSCELILSFRWCCSLSQVEQAVKKLVAGVLNIYNVVGNAVFRAF